MRGLALYFFTLAVVAAVVGMAWGIQMSATNNHLLSPAHAHLNLLGWVTLALFGIYYHLCPRAAQGVLPKLHFALAVLGVVIIVPGIVMALRETGETLAKVGSILSVASMLLFLFIVLRNAGGDTA
ncbi:MAG: hypothetical protein RI566_12030 [Sediminimonas sp.]|uniref:hypothetical protein n=1 Tax=Sediminimonas sp. TaxID=2823379 RepID=UPI0028709C9B|nr:hypothetical protein [Sediminimonas sp.]MDR9485893.1 hypothetical protein [Sediminimonas sp.]